MSEVPQDKALVAPVAVSEKETVKRAPTLYVIIGIKLIKGVLLLLIGLGVYSLSDSNLSEDFRNLLQFFHLDPEKEFFSALAAKISKITPQNVMLLATGTGIYSLFSLVEG